MNEAPFEAHADRSKILLLIALSAGFVALGIWFALGAPGSPRPASVFLRGFGPVCALFFLGTGLEWARLLRFKGPVLRIDASGIYYARWGEAVIPWDGIERIRAITIKGQQFTGLWLTPEVRMTGRFWRRSSAAMARIFGRADLHLTSHGADRSYAEMRHALRAHGTPLFKR